MTESGTATKKPQPSRERLIFQKLGETVFSNHPDWAWLVENRHKLQRLLDAGK